MSGTDSSFQQQMGDMLAGSDELKIEFTRAELQEKFREFMYKEFPKSMRKSSDEAENNFYVRLGLGHQFFDDLFDQHDIGEG